MTYYRVGLIGDQGVASSDQAVTFERKVALEVDDEDDSAPFIDGEQLEIVVAGNKLQKVTTKRIKSALCVM